MLYGRITDDELELLAQRSALQDVFERATPIVVLVSAVLAVLIVVWLVTQNSAGAGRQPPPAKRAGRRERAGEPAALPRFGSWPSRWCRATTR